MIAPLPSDLRREDISGAVHFWVSSDLRREDMWGAVHFWLSNLYFSGSSGIMMENRRNGFIGAKGSASNNSADLFRKGFTGAVPKVPDISTERCLQGMTGAVADIAFTKIERSRIGWAGRRLAASDTTMDRCRQGITGGVPRVSGISMNIDNRPWNSLTGAASISLGSSTLDMVGSLSFSSLLYVECEPDAVLKNETTCCLCFLRRGNSAAPPRRKNPENRIMHTGTSTAV
jgi:hypothetical protein